MIHLGCQWGCSSICLPNIKGIGSLPILQKRKKERRKKERELILDVRLTRPRCLLDLNDVSEQIWYLYGCFWSLHIWTSGLSGPYLPTRHHLVRCQGLHERNKSPGIWKNPLLLWSGCLSSALRLQNCKFFGLWDSHFQQTSAAGSQAFHDLFSWFSSLLQTWTEPGYSLPGFLVDFSVSMIVLANCLTNPLSIYASITASVSHSFCLLGEL